MKRTARHLPARLLTLAVLVLLGTGFDTAKEYELKAAFLYNFTKFIEWPDEAFAQDDERFVLAVLGKDPFGETLDKVLAGKRVGDRELVIRRVAEIEDLGPCHMLFLSDNMEDQLQEVLDRLGSASVLTVAEFEDSITQGVAIGFRTSGRKLRFDINASAANARSLKVSSQLLSLAGTVIDGQTR